MASYDDTATVSGSVAYFSDGADEVPCKSVKVTLPASLTGYNSASVVNSGLQIADFENNLNSSSYGCTIEKLSGGGIRFHGTTTQTYLNLTSLFDCEIKSGVSITLSRATARPYRVYVYLKFEDNTTANVIINQNASSVTYTTTKKVIQIRLDASGLTASTEYDETIFVVLQYGSSASSYEPYNPTTYSANLGRTVYGAEVELVSGTGKDTGAIHTITSENVNELIRLDGHRFYIHNRNTHCITPSTDDADSVVCDKLKSQTGGSVYDNRCFINASGAIRINTTSEYATNSDFLEDFGGSITFAFILDPSYYTDFTFDGQEIPTRKGYNAFWSEQGDTELTYYKDGYGFTSVTLTRCGKNLIDKSQAVFGSINASTGGDINSSTRLRSPWIKLNPSTQYTLSTNNNTLQVYELYQYTSDKTKIRSDRADAQSYTFTTTATTVYMRVIFRHADNSAPTLSELDNTQLELGSQASSYEPYEAISKTAKLHRIVYGGTADVVKGTAKPKNLFDDSTFPRTATDNTYYAQFQSNLAEGNKYKIPTIHIEPEVAYVLSFDVECNTEPFNASVGIGIGSYSRDIANANNNTSGRISVPFTLTSALKEQYGDILSFRVPRYSTPREFTFTISNVQLEKASSASEYAPHFEPFSFPPISMETDEGENTLFANEGASAITYRKAVD